jgi:hypothetical protein
VTPGKLVVISPVCDTDATIGFEEDQVKVFIEALFGKTVLVSCNVLPIYNVELAGEILTLFTNVFENAVYKAFASRVPLIEPTPVVLSYPGVLL